MATYPRVWRNVLNDSAEQHAIAGERVPVFDENAPSVVVVFAEGGPLFIGAPPQFAGQQRKLARVADRNRREPHIVQAEQLGLVAEVDREGWPEWLAAQIDRHLGPS